MMVHLSHDVTSKRRRSEPHLSTVGVRSTHLDPMVTTFICLHERTGCTQNVLVIITTYLPL